MVHATIILLCVAVIGINTISSLPGKTRVSSKIKLTSTPLFLNSPSSIDEYMQIWSEKCLKAFNSEILLHEVSIPNTYSYSIGSVGKKTVTFQSTAYTSDNFEYLRFVSLNGNGFNVLNILALPKDRFDVPIFGVDIVSLPGGGCLAAIDFQPLSTSPEYFSSELYQPYEEELQQWQQKLPDGGELPTAAKRFFSPLRLWTRMSVKDDEYSMNLKNLNEALDNYTRCYLRIVSEAKAENALSTTTINERKIAIADYLKYRVENDPASGLLNSAYGKEWTETVLREVVFPASYPVSATKL